MTIKLKKLTETAQIPTYGSDMAAGLDLRADIKEPLIMYPGQRILIPTGISIELPIGFEAQIRPRSGLAIKHGITVLNSPGTVDADFRGEIKVILINLGVQNKDVFVIRPGDRIAQMIIGTYNKASFDVVEELNETDRGGGAFGSTGLS